MTNKQNFQGHLQSISQPLPTTFNDAVLVARELGVRFLWIDSLCIIQDSPEDWAVHAPQMAKVYGGAYATIAADAAKDSAAGFLSGCRRHLSSPKTVAFSCDGHDGLVYVRKRGSLAYQLPYHDWSEPGRSIASRIRGPKEVVDRFCREQEPPESGLSTRGWVFQERVLSPRTLHFGGAETGWECRSLINCECSASSMRYHRKTSLLKRALSKMAWTTVVEEYTRLRLTFEEDRLVALSGLAEARKHLSNDIYIAGMWLNNLKRELLWRSDVPTAKSAVRRLDIAPTWSWASVTCPVVYEDQTATQSTGSTDTIESNWDILGFPNNTVSGTSSFGKCVAGTYLRMRGYLVEVNFWRDIDADPLHYYVQPNKRDSAILFQIFWDTSELESISASSDDEHTRYTVLLVTRAPAPPRGLLMGCPSENASQIPGTGEPHQKYQRVAYIVPPRRRRGCDWPDPEDTASAEGVNVQPEEWNWPSWQKNESLQEFRIF